MAGPLDSAHAVTKLPVQNLDRARRFYRDRLGLEAVEEREGGLRYVCGTPAELVQRHGKSGVPGIGAPPGPVVRTARPRFPAAVSASRLRG
jgi:catechol 2,3-dioxygenase-like lactoylglutathione lyase family enzyme